MIVRSGEEKRKEDKAIVQEFKRNDHCEESLQGEGNLFLTTQRLVLERQVKGKPVIVFEFPLKAVDEVKVKGFIGKVLLLKVVLKKINSAIKGINFSGKKGLVNLKIKVNDPKTYATEISYGSKKE